MCLCALALGHGAGTPFTLSLLGSVTSDGTSLSCPPVHRMGTPPHPPQAHHRTGHSETRTRAVSPIAPCARSRVCICVSVAVL